MKYYLFNKHKHDTYSIPKYMSTVNPKIRNDVPHYHQQVNRQECPLKRLCVLTIFFLSSFLILREIH